ncbi:MAG TPA: hypothetical protein PLD27_10605 [bacterium]|nr:hypothetical protein [bacterium]HOL47884.1 hypothetical protein [bacterium]HPQ19678.1 hypothetical protein [bacterium]
MNKINVNYDPTKKAAPNQNIEEELVSRYKLENMYLKKQLEEKEKELEEKNKLIGKLNKQIIERDQYIERISTEFKQKEYEIMKQYENIEKLIEPVQPQEEKQSLLVRLLNYLDIKISYI